MRGGRREHAGRKQETVAGIAPSVPPGAFSRDLRRVIADLGDVPYGASAIARWLGVGRGRVRRILERNGKLKGAELIYLGKKP